MKQFLPSLFLAPLIAALCLPIASRADPVINVVSTLSSYADLVRQIGGERVSVTSIAAPRFNPHFIEPRPSDVLRVKRADLFVHSGLDLEAWRGPLLDAVAKSEFRSGGSRQLDLSEGIALLEVPEGQVSRAEGDIHQFGNPHYWIDPRNGLIIARHIERKLVEVDSAGRSIYERNLADFEARLEAKMVSWRETMRPHAGKVVLGYHKEWPYLVQFLGLSMERFVEPKPGIPPGPQHLEQLVEYIKSQQAKVLVQASYSPSEAGEFLREKAGIVPLVLCQNVAELPQCPDYIAMVDYAVTSIAKALR